MKFSKLHSDITFRCVNDEMEQNTKDIFARKLFAASPQEKDFESKWEQGKRGNTDPVKVCMLKGISVHKHRNDEDIAKLYSDIHKYAPKWLKDKYYCKFRFKEGAGKMRLTSYRAPFHCTFFKSDDFNLKMVDVLETKGF